MTRTTSGWRSGLKGVATVEGMQTDSIPLDPDGNIHVYFMAGRDMEGKPTTRMCGPRNVSGGTRRPNHYDTPRRS
jgi:hypothetical protein